ncbi:MAG TPA: cytochrome c [Methyloceanibacter sp.]|nr:cytochrome c [Methyloceanibacter sp.]
MAVLFAAGLVSPALAVEKGLADKGEVLVRENCARCHAVGLVGDSPNPEAPPFRTLSSKYPIEDLAESLAEGIVSGHPEMPIFVFKPHDIDAIIAYLESIQETPADPEEMPDAAPGETTDG